MLPLLGWYVFAEQFAQPVLEDDVPAGLTYLPALQVLQVAHDVWLLLVVYVPELQLVHVRLAVLEPAKLTLFPGPQFRSLSMSLDLKWS